MSTLYWNNMISPFIDQDGSLWDMALSKIPLKPHPNVAKNS
ncbi:MAG: hypothetical protein VKL42_13875 [Snowella sp.]|nr:hypothetical protein [Snowella sp.]